MENRNTPHSQKSLVVHGVVLKNRYVMGSMHTGLEDKWNYQALAKYLEERAKGEVGLIITGGFSPNMRGRLSPLACEFSRFWHLKKHRLLTKSVQKHGCKIALQILHAGRYSYHPFSVSPSKIKSPISPFTPHALWNWEIEKTIKDFIKCAKLTKKAGYDGVEIMGSEGYLINQFIAERTNKRQDKWGGSFKNRIRFPLAIVRGIRKELGPHFLIVYRLSMLDLVEGGSRKDEVIMLAQELEKAGASIINTGIGWHEARVPTIVTSVPRAAFSFVTKEVKESVSIPCIAANRFNNPEDVERALEENHCDLVSMARPFLADPYFVKKYFEGNKKLINTCIACNQACLDHVFENKKVSCLVNPKACNEVFYDDAKLSSLSSKVLVIGAGPAGLSAALGYAQRGSKVTLVDSDGVIGGQFNLAKNIPGKEEFAETIRYFEESLKMLGVHIELNVMIEGDEAFLNDFDQVVVATGVRPRKINLPGIESKKVISYFDLIKNNIKVGDRIAIIGAGGIGFDVATYLLDRDQEDDFFDFWGVDKKIRHTGGLKEAISSKSNKRIFLLQRKNNKIGTGLGKTTGWVHRLRLKKQGVEMINGVQYKEVNDKGLVILEKGKARLLEVDHIIVCAGQVSNTSLIQKLQGLIGSNKVKIIGGARLAGELDAKRAIKEGFLLSRA